MITPLFNLGPEAGLAVAAGIMLFCTHGWWKNRRQHGR